MKAVRFHEHASPAVLRYEDAPDPRPGPGLAIVRVAACALNHLDLWHGVAEPDVITSAPATT